MNRAFDISIRSHFSGIWKAGINNIKFQVKHVIGARVLTFEEFHTLITRIEGILNSRPITLLSSDSHDLCTLIPGDFLIKQPFQAIPEPDIIDIRVKQLTRLSFDNVTNYI